MISQRVRSTLLGLLCVMLMATAAPCWAGHPCNETALQPHTIMKALELAQKTKLQLDESQADVAVIARVGQDLSKYHLRYSHLGIVRHEADGKWVVMHELNQCGTANSSLFNEGLGNFFMDDLFAYETMILIPSADLQQKLRAEIDSGKARQLHEPRYNMVAYAFSTEYQNSNQWVIEVLAAAQANDVQITKRQQAQTWLKFAGYQPDTLHIDALTRLGGRMFRANVAFDDHPFDRRMTGKIDVVTVDSIARFMMARDPKTEKVTLSL